MRASCRWLLRSLRFSAGEREDSRIVDHYSESADAYIP